jgi:predicted metal-dependent phosphoesterase TrpH
MTEQVRADLHLHTTASDGMWTPARLVAEVQRAGIGLFSVTDHDSLDGLTETMERVCGNGLRFLPGVEVSARLDGQLHHLLAYGFDLADSALTTLVAANGARLRGAGDDAVRLLAEAGYPISLEDYAAYTWDRRRGGWKSLNYLMDRGFCRDIRAYFDELFVGALAHPEPEFPPPEQVIGVAHQANGVVILAHPGALFRSGLDEQRLDQLVEMGLDGLECYSCHHDHVTTRRLLEYCRHRNLLITGGSDCHGGFVGRPLGMPLIHAGDLRLGVLEERMIGCREARRQ